MQSENTSAAGSTAAGEGLVTAGAPGCRAELPQLGYAGQKYASVWKVVVTEECQFLHSDLPWTAAV